MDPTLSSSILTARRGGLWLVVCTQSPHLPAAEKLLLTLHTSFNAQSWLETSQKQSLPFSDVFQ